MPKCVHTSGAKFSASDELFFVSTIKATASLARTSQAWKNEALFFCLEKLAPLLQHRVVNILLIRFSLLESFVRLLSRIL